ncbi:hypothetical protein RFI_39078 [Reticulomyxa filosa]|uniref:EF-hand domain-containing protein n=1 Tax=Reticulomyxa filosa TaxID=46433 RepID=X6L8T4_RETFI|nr:hypothetical protein RFI_39078 [Reticulomyxa filosa]|eukprot:ETN98422.1 hypothetical protein RFI_39078 [Reticulomyxa filosa]
MILSHFEEMLTSLERYYDLAKQDGEIIQDCRTAAGENVEIDSEEYQAKKTAAQELTSQVFEIIDVQHSGDLNLREIENGFTTIGFDDWTQIFKASRPRDIFCKSPNLTRQRIKKERGPTKSVKKIKKSLEKEEDTSPFVKKEEPDTSVTTPSSMIPHMTTTSTSVIADVSITEVTSTTIIIELSLTAEIATSIETVIIRTKIRSIRLNKTEEQMDSLKLVKCNIEYKSKYNDKIINIRFNTATSFTLHRFSPILYSPIILGRRYQRPLQIFGAGIISKISLNESKQSKKVCPFQ